MLEFFIRRPIFSMVISLVITFAGLVCVGILPIAYFPDVTPPTAAVLLVSPTIASLRGCHAHSRARPTIN